MKILIVGLGSIGKKHVDAIKRLKIDAEIYALRTSVNSRIVHGVNNVFDYTTLNTYNLDFAIISNPTALHHETIQRLLFLNIPLFIEKPVFYQLESEALLTQIEHKGIITYVACNLRFLDSLRETKRLLKGKRINEVNIYCGSYLPDWRENTDFREVYSAKPELGGGVHLDLIHEIDYMYWLFGKPIGIRRSLGNSSSLHIEAADYANFLFHYDGFYVNTVLNYFRRDAKRSLEIVCEDGTLLINLLENRIYWNGEQIFHSSQRISDTYVAQLDFFVKNILSKKETFNTIFEAYEILKICLGKD